MVSDKQIKADNAFLLARPEFLRFLDRVIQMARIYEPTTDGSEGRHLAYWEGRRNLGLEVLHDAARGQAVDDPEAAFTLTAIQILREAAQQSTPEKTANAKRSRYDRNADLDPDDQESDAD